MMSWLDHVSFSSCLVASSTAVRRRRDRGTPFETGWCLNTGDVGGEPTAEVEELAWPPSRVAVCAPESRHP
jgi:hypothetical protein